VQRRDVFLLMGLLILSIFVLPLTPTSSEAFPSSKVSTEPQQAGQRTVEYRWHSWFNVSDPRTGKLGEWWDTRSEVGGEDMPVHREYPMIVAWESSPGNMWYYTLGRLKVTGRNLPEINMTKGNSWNGSWSGTKPWPWIPSTPPKMLGVGEFLPYNLTGHTPSGTPPGNAKVSFYMNYLTEAEWPGTDGWIVSTNGTIELDLDAAKRVLGITDTELADVASWWTANEDAVERAWYNWLAFEGNKRLDIYNCYAWWYSLSVLDLNVRRVGDKVIVDLLNLITWGQDCLFARWFKETFLPGYEYWYEDLHLNATITPTYANVDLDTGVSYLSYAYASSWYGWGVATYMFETMWLDLAPSTKAHPYSEFNPYMWPNGTAKKYYVSGPGNSLTGQWMAYDYVPSTWNLKQGETLIFEVPLGLYVPSYLDGGSLHYGSLEARNVTEVWGYLELGYTEPNIVTEYFTNETGKYPVPPVFPTSGAGSISWNSNTRRLTFIGPIDFYDWSIHTALGTGDYNEGLAENWKRLSWYTYPNGTKVYTPTLPWGSPYVEFIVKPGVLVNPAKVVGDETMVGKTFSVNVNLTYGTNLNNWAFNMSYDPDILQVVSATEGNHLKSGGTTTFNNGTIGTGNLTGVSSSLGTGLGVNGSGTLATVTFEVLKAGNSSLDLTSVKLFDSKDGEIPTVLFSGLYEGGAAPPPPVDYTWYYIAAGVAVAVVVVIGAGVYLMRKRKPKPPPA